jgi:ribosome-associated protein
LKNRDVFKLEGKEFIELDNLLKVTGLCESGGSAKTVIAEGRVTVDGHVELRRRCKLRAGQVVEFEGHTVVVA